MKVGVGVGGGGWCFDHTILYSVHNRSVCLESGWCTGGGGFGGGVFVM